jgi:outer membrane lipoprotein-sorting protein
MADTATAYATDRTADRDRVWQDNLARILAGVALILALIALGWAAKADNTANSAMNKANQAMSAIRNSSAVPSPSGNGTLQQNGR